MITEDYVSFETAKLLKEKGFDWEESPFYSEQDRDEWRQNNNYTIPNKSYNPDLPFDSETITLIAPHVSLQMAMKWLREKYDLHIEITSIKPYGSDGNGHDIPLDGVKYHSNIVQNNKWIEIIKKFKSHSIACYSSYEEACEAAIKYCLKNLIKNEDEEEESDIPVPKTVDEAISTLEKILSDEDKEYLLKNGAISMHNSLGRWIRNEWGLWTNSELKNELKKKGFEHPDDMSNYIIEEFIKYWNNRL